MDLNLSGVIESVIGLVREVVPDNDKRAELQVKLAELQTKVTEAVATLQAKVAELDAQVRQAELQVKTYPWVDALHKMGRQIMAAYILIVVPAMSLLDKPLPSDTIMWMCAVAGIYTAMKGKGQ